MQIPREYTEVDATHLVSHRLFTEDDFIFTETPTMEMIREAETSSRFVVAFFEIATFGSLAQYRERFNLVPCNYCILVPKYNGYTFDELKKYWLDRYLAEFNNTEWMPTAGLNRGEKICVSLSQEAGP